MTPPRAASGLRPSHLAAASALALATAFAMPASAQSPGSKLSLLDFLDPDRIAARVLQMGVGALRTQMDLVYGTMTASVTGGSATLTDLKVWPMLDWDTDGQCEVTFDRVRLQGTPLQDLDRARLSFNLTGGSFTAECLPPEALLFAKPILGDTVRISRATIDLDYNIPKGSALFTLRLNADDLVGIEAVVDLDYLWFDSGDYMRDPMPIAFLNSARVTVDNYGLWQKVEGMLPPLVTDPAQYEPMIDEGIQQIDRFAETPSAQRALLGDSVKSAWAAFVADPRRLILESSFTDGPRYLDFETWDRSGPDAMLDDLQPRMVSRLGAVASLPPRDLITAAYEAPDSLSAEDALTIGKALASGIGAPRDPQQAMTVLLPQMDAGNGEAALILARLLEKRDTPYAYTLALIAAERATDGAAGLLDRIEAALPLATVLQLQGEQIAGLEHPIEALDSLTTIREEAVGRFYGKGRTRSYELALLWATIGAAAGDAESIAILAEIDGVISNADAEARSVWDVQEAASIELARQAWLGFDLTTTYGGQ